MKTAMYPQTLIPARPFSRKRRQKFQVPQAPRLIRQEGREVPLTGKHFEKVKHCSLPELALLIADDIRTAMESSLPYDFQFDIRLEGQRAKERLLIRITDFSEDIINEDFISKAQPSSKAVLSRSFLEKNTKNLFTKAFFDVQTRISQILNDYNSKLYHWEEKKTVLKREHFSLKIHFDEDYIDGLLKSIPSMPLNTCFDSLRRAA